MEPSIFFWIGFHLLIALLLWIDFNLLKKHPTKGNALLLTIFWIGAALLFNALLYFLTPSDQQGTIATQFFTAYLIEKSLSIDNLFLFLLIFGSFQISRTDQQKILFWGFLGALLFRLTFILAGIALINSFHWLFYLLGIFLLITGIKFFLAKKKKQSLKKSKIYHYLCKYLPLSQKNPPATFFIRERSRWKCTQLFLILLLIEWTDILFALDSIPAVFSITLDPFIAYTSNIFAILGLRSLFFVLSPLLQKLHYLQQGLAAILIFTGLKMVLADLYPISVPISLGVITAILAITFCRQLLRPTHF